MQDCTKKVGVIMRLNKEHYKSPILLGFETNDHQVAVWCPYCVSYHFHGKEEGYRTPHCINPQSPFLESGYIVKFPTKKQANFENGARKPSSYFPKDTEY